MEYYIGTILLLPYGFVPMDMVLCNGQLLQVNQFSPLFSLIYTTYGGNGQTTFAVPNMLGQEPNPGMNYYIVTTGMYPVRD
jgi:microcystin-dependent protein